MYQKMKNIKVHWSDARISGDAMDASVLSFQSRKWALLLGAVASTRRFLVG
jgi:hypothetical protein